MTIASNWFTWALFSAVFAALTAIFAKIGLAGVNRPGNRGGPLG